MAGSDYSLRLRATLDTTQVQQELKKLRAAQAMVLDQGGAGINKGLPGMAHVQKIEVQLTKLNSAISGLQRAVEQLSRSQNMKRTPVPGPGGRNNYIPPGLNQKNFKEWMQSREYASLNRQVRQMLSKHSILGGHAHVGKNIINIGDIDSPDLAHRLWGTGDLAKMGFGDDYNRNQYEMRRRNWNQLNSKSVERAIMRQRRQFASLIGGQLLGGAGDIATSLGYENFGRSISNIGEGVTAGAGAAMGASLAGIGGKASGIIGVVVGFGTAITKNISSMEQLAQSVNKVAKAFDENYISLHRQTRSIQESILSSRHQTRAGQLLESGNLDEAKKQAKYWSDAYKSAKDTFESVGDPQDEENKIRRHAEDLKTKVDEYVGTSRAEDLFGKDSQVVGWLEKTLGFSTYGMRKQEVLNKIDEDAQKQIQDMQQRYKDREAEMNKAKGFADTYQSVVDKLEGDREDEFNKSKIEVQRRLQLSDRNDQAIASYRAQGEANRTQIFANDVLGDKLTSPLEKFNKIAEQLDAARARRNEALTGAYGIAKDIAGGKMTSEEMTRAMAKQSKLDTQAAQQQNLIGILETALQNISTKAVTPDLSHMTSLAQYGFNMGEKDDTVERMDKYYSKSLNLQQQIKDKLDEGIKTEAVYNN